MAACNLHGATSSAMSGDRTLERRYDDDAELLRETLLVMLDDVMFADSASLPPRDDRAEGGDPAVQLSAMLVSLACDGGFPGGLMGEGAVTGFFESWRFARGPSGSLCPQHHKAAQR